MSCRAVHLRFRSLNIVSLSDIIEGSDHSWDLYTTDQLVDGLQQRKPVFIKRKWNHVFSRATILSFHPVLMLTELFEIELIIYIKMDLALNMAGQELILYVETF